MVKKIRLDFTVFQLETLVSVMETIEAMQGGSDDEHGYGDWDTETNKQIKTLDRMLKSNGYKRE